jgi:ferredoxin--NADP+ reductase
MLYGDTESTRVKILSNKKISPGSAILSFDIIFSFKAGQVTGLTTDPAIPPRLYSICSGEKENRIDILYNIVPQGQLTPLLEHLKPGDPLLVTPPFGKFIPVDKPSCFIATGTGLAPFLSMLKSGFGQCRLLLHGNRHPNDFYESNYLRSILGMNYVPCYSGKEKFQGYNGRVTQYINDVMKADTADMYYLCGSAEMVVDARELLISKGVPFQAIQSEIYF